MYLKAEQNKYMCFYNNNHNSIWLYIVKKQYPGLRHTGIYLLSCMILTTIHPLIHTFFDFTYCVPRSFSLLSCIGFILYSCYRWSRGVTILQLQVSIQQLISRVVWGQTYNIGPCCNYFVDLYENNYILCWSILRLFCWLCTTN